MFKHIALLICVLSLTSLSFLFCFSDDFTQMLADYLRENPWIIWLGLGSFGMGLIFSLLQKRKQSVVSKSKSSESKSASKESSKKSK